MKRKTLAAETTVVDQELGQIEAQVSGWDSDRERDTIAPTAFDKTIAAWRASGKMLPLLFEHSSEEIGHIDPFTMRATEAGLVAGGEVDRSTEQVSRSGSRSSATLPVSRSATWPSQGHARAVAAICSNRPARDLGHEHADAPGVTRTELEEHAGRSPLRRRTAQASRATGHQTTHDKPRAQAPHRRGETRGRARRASASRHQARRCCRRRGHRRRQAERTPAPRAQETLRRPPARNSARRPFEAPAPAGDDTLRRKAAELGHPAHTRQSDLEAVKAHERKLMLALLRRA